MDNGFLEVNSSPNLNNEIKKPSKKTILITTITTIVLVIAMVTGLVAFIIIDDKKQKEFERKIDFS